MQGQKKVHWLSLPVHITIINYIFTPSVLQGAQDSTQDSTMLHFIFTTMWEGDKAVRDSPKVIQCTSRLNANLNLGVSGLS